VSAEGTSSVCRYPPSSSLVFSGFLPSRSPAFFHPPLTNSDHNVFAQPEIHKQCLISPLVTTSGSGDTLDPVANLSTSIPMASNVTATDTHSLSFTMIVSFSLVPDYTEKLTCGSKRS
jgi:hypothetical protein